MGLAEDIARVRARARGAEINARHRRSRERALALQSHMGAPSSPDGVHPEFAKKLEEARARAKHAAERDAQPRSPADRIEQLVREGKLPPRPGDLGVGYEPTPEEVLGELSGPTAPDGTEDLPDAAAVLAGDAPAAPGDWGAPPAAAAPQAVLGAPSAPVGHAPLAHSTASVQSKRKRGR